MKSISRPCAAILAGVVVLAASGRAQDELPPRRPAAPLDIEKFRALESTERLNVIEKLAPGKLPFVAISRGDLAAAVVERGVVEPIHFADMVCMVKATGKESSIATTIKWVIDDGSWVKKGDRLVELDDSMLRDQLAVAKVKALVAEAARVQAVENVEIVKKEYEVELRLAEIELKLVELELKDPPAGQSKAVLELKVERAKLQLERARTRAKSQHAQAEAEKRAQTAAAELEAQRLRDIEAEIKNCVLVAPMDGIAIYHVPTSSRFGGAAPVIAPGESVREGQKLLRVCDLKQLAIGTRIHEAVVSSVAKGQSARVRVDAIPQKILSGKVTHVSPLAAQVDFMARDVKVYPVTIALEEVPAGLKPGMSAEVQVSTGERKGVLQAPVKAVWSTGRERICFIKVGQELVERQVVVGMSNASSVEIKQGLKEGDMVLAELASLLAPSPAGGKSFGPAKGKRGPDR
jgi:multidrug efflux pump subunit AcrA (membrane-fusion protein)